MCCALKKVKNKTWMPWVDFEIEVFMKLILRQNIIIISVCWYVLTQRLWSLNTNVNKSQFVNVDRTAMMPKMDLTWRDSILQSFIDQNSF